MIGEQPAGFLQILFQNGVQDIDMFPVAGPIPDGAPGGDPDQVQVVHQAAHQVGGILISKRVHQFQVEAVVQLDQRRRRLGGIAGAVVLVLEQQCAHIHCPLRVHHGEALAEDRGLQQ